MEESPAGRHGTAKGRLPCAERFSQLIEAIRAARSHNEIMVNLHSRILSAFEVEMASIFLVDAFKKQLVSWVLAPGNVLHKIRVPIDTTSIAGYAATKRNSVIVNDAYDREELRRIDPRLQFDSFWDRKAGSRTRQVVAAPILFQRSLMGVIQLMNRRDGLDFTAQDTRQVTALAEILGTSFHNLQRPV